MNKKEKNIILVILFLLFTVFCCMGEDFKNFDGIKSISKYYFFKSILNQCEPINKNDIKQTFSLLNRIENSLDSTMIIDTIYSTNDIKIFKANLSFKSLYAIGDIFFALEFHQFDIETYELNKNNILSFVNKNILTNKTKDNFLDIVRLINQILVDRTAIFLTKSNLYNEFEYLTNEYKLDSINEIKMEDDGQYYEQYYKIKDGKISSYIVILYKYENNRINIEKQLLFKLIESGKN